MASRTKADNEAVLKELKEVLASPQFRNSKRYPALLRYVVEHALAGQAEHLKERTLAVEVFGRPATYDTSLDTVVRYTAGEIRKRLLIYYHERGRSARIHIHLPAGSYVPEFVCAPADEAKEPAAVTLRAFSHLQIAGEVYGACGNTTTLAFGAGVVSLHEMPSDATRRGVIAAPSSATLRTDL